MTAPIYDSDNIKPSRIKRRRKWRIQNLTSISIEAMLCTHSQKTSAEFSTSHNQGHQRPLSNVVFLCPSKTQAALCRLFSVMVGCIGRPLKRSAGSWAGVENPMQSATQLFSTLCGGLSLYQGVTAMVYAPNAPQYQGQIPPKPTQQPEAVNDFLQQIIALDTERQVVTEAGIPALVRLADNGGELFERWAQGGV